MKSGVICIMYSTLYHNTWSANTVEQVVDLLRSKPHSKVLTSLGNGHYIYCMHILLKSELELSFVYELIISASVDI